MGFTDRLTHAWNAFFVKDQSLEVRGATTYSGYGLQNYRSRMRISNERSIVAAIYTRLSIDVAAIPIRHVRVDENERYLETIASNLNSCLNLSANIDQAGRAFRQDMALSLFDKGVIAIVPTKTSNDPMLSDAYDVRALRVGEIVTWYPQHVRVSVYNDETGRREELILPKKIVAIVENPLYSVMNEPNSTLQRLIRKLNILDAIDEQSGAGKLDIIIQLPYVVKSEAREKQAEKRRKDLEMQLQGSKYGIGYVDSTEHITQLNRPAENNLLKQVTYLTDMLYGQLGLTPEVFNGTADEATMINYYNRTIDPVVSAITESMKRTFLSRTAITQHQSLESFRDPFKLTAISNIAEIADKFTRNEILSSNEIRGIVGFRPSTDPKADQLVNSNISQAKQPSDSAPEESPPEEASVELRQVKEKVPSGNSEERLSITK